MSGLCHLQVPQPVDKQQRTDLSVHSQDCSFTEGGEERIRSAHSFRATLETLIVWKVLIAPHSRYCSAQIKDWGKLWRTKGGCPIFRLPLARSCTGHILQGRTRNLSTTSLSPHLLHRDGSNPSTLIHWPELQHKEITPWCFQTALGILKAPRLSPATAARLNRGRQSQQPKQPISHPSCGAAGSSFNQEILPYHTVELQLYLPVSAKVSPI